MQVQIDSVWCSPSTMHVRVTIWGPDYKWRHKYDASIPLEDIDEGALAPWLKTLGAGPFNDAREQLPLF